VTLELHATPDEVMRAVEALQEFGRKHGVGEKDLFGLALTLEECASNVVNHALQRDGQKTFRVRFEFVGASFLIELRDDGPSFDPTTARVRPKATEADDETAGGWGIQLVRRYTDEIQYARAPGENVLRLIKRVGQELPPNSLA
jgi:serine/threonine-protein kinase RsbW